MVLDVEQMLRPVAEKVRSIRAARDRRWFVDCPVQYVVPVCRFLFEQVRLRFVISTGVDAEGCFEVLHHFCHDGSGSFVTVRVCIPDRSDPHLDSIAPFMPTAEWIEREIQDLLGIRFDGHPNPKRLILADDWPEGVYPLRKDFKP
ncbi:MAG: NADH-quinone oxidoreductase subunit C [Sedimentisphaerales bacterium]|nr:NADH-quinone oxidoreductase subunit C [Sedimentisphaerales bacterium]